MSSPNNPWLDAFDTRLQVYAERDHLAAQVAAVEALCKEKVALLLVDAATSSTARAELRAVQQVRAALTSASAIRPKPTMPEPCVNCGKTWAQCNRSIARRRRACCADCSLHVTHNQDAPEHQGWSDGEQQ
jgi:hypothetical protein